MRVSAQAKALQPVVSQLTLSDQLSYWVKAQSKGLNPMLFDLRYRRSSRANKNPAYRGTSISEFHAAFPSDEACLSYMFRKRFGERPVCQRCAKNTPWHQVEKTRLFKHSCAQRLFPQAATLADRSTTPLQLWFYAMLHFSNSRVGICTNFLSSHLGISTPAAFRMAERIRTQMAMVDRGSTFGDPLRPVSVKLLTMKRVRTHNQRGAGRANVFVIGDNQSILTTVIGRARRSLLAQILRDKVVKGVPIQTDCERTYRVLSDSDRRPAIAEFAPSLPPPLSSTCVPISIFWQNVNRAIGTTHRHVDRRYLWKYLKEFEFRFNRRHRPEAIFWDMISGFPSFSDTDLKSLAQDCYRIDRPGPLTLAETRG